MSRIPGRKFWTSEGRKIQFENFLHRAANWTKLAPNRVLADNIRSFLPLLPFREFIQGINLQVGFGGSSCEQTLFRIFTVSRSCDRKLGCWSLSNFRFFSPQTETFWLASVWEPSAKPFIFPFMWQITRSINSKRRLNLTNLIMDGTWVTALQWMLESPDAFFDKSDCYLVFGLSGSSLIPPRE